MKAAFLDRDGTIIEDVGYINSPEYIRFLPGAIEGLKKLKRLGFSLFIVTNQSGINRGYLSFERYRLITNELVKRLLMEHVWIKDVIFCPYHPSVGSGCRKPSPTMLFRLRDKYPEIVFEESFMIGDKESDVQAGLEAGTRAIRISSVPVETQAEVVVESLLEAANYIEKIQ